MMKHSLPAISGVRPLSRNEIKKDISEIECYDRSDTESNSSVLSEDVLSSTYPVKPRRHTKPKVEQRVKQVVTKEVGDIDQNIVEETIEFLRIVENARPDVFEAEQEREELEIKYQALRDMCISEEETFKKRKTSLENYLRAIQTQSRNTLNAYDTLSLQNSLLYDILIALKSRRKTCQQLGIPLPTSELLSSLLSSNHTIDTKSSIYFYVSQVLQTPKGVGTVTSIDKQKSTISIYFTNPIPFTEEFSCSSLYSYFKKLHLENPDIYHLLNLQHKWNPALINQLPLGLTTPIQKNMNNIQSFTEDDLLFHIPPLNPITSQNTNELLNNNNNNNNTNNNTNNTNNTNANTNNKKTKKGNKLVSVDDHLSIITPSTNLVTPLTKSLIESIDGNNDDTPINPSISYLFIKPSTLPFVIERTQYIPPAPSKQNFSETHNNLNNKNIKHDQNNNNNNNNNNNSLKQPPQINLELSSQAYSPLIYTHHALPNPYDDTFHETIGFDATNQKSSNGSDLSDYQSVDPLLENEITKLQRLVKPLLKRIRECREQTKGVALNVERCKMSQIRQYQELSSLRLGLFTQQLLARQSHINSDKNSNQLDNHLVNHFGDVKGNTKESSNNSRGGNHSKKKTKGNNVSGTTTSLTTTTGAGTSTNVTSNLQLNGNTKETITSSSHSNSTSTTQNVNDSNTTSQRPKRRKAEKVEDDITDQLSQDNDEPEPLPAAGNTKSKRQRR